MGGFPAGPWFPREIGFPGTGVDFLGLRSVNMRLIDDCLPGISNVTYHIRCYSVASWTWWKVHELMDGKGKRSSGDLHAFSERVETLFAWGHRIYGYSGASGSRSGPPSAGAVPLDFASWNRSGRNTSIMAAVRYGPSVKTTNGLGFLEPREGGTFAVVGPGRAMAEALDAELRPLVAYRLLDRLEPVTGRERDAENLVDAWCVGEVSEGEAAAFWSALHRPEELGTATRNGRRTGLIDLLLHALRTAAEPMDRGALRRCLATGRLSDGTPLDLPAALGIVRERWLAMQARQLQRLALEALLTWSEDRMLRHRCRRIEDLRASLCDAMEAATALPRNSSWGDVLDAALRALDEDEVGPDAALFKVWKGLRQALREKDGDGIIGAALAAFECGRAITRGLLEGTQARNAGSLSEPDPDGEGDPILAACAMGGMEQLSLSAFRGWLTGRAGEPASTVVIDLLETHVLSRHLAVGVGRFDGERQRLRFTLEEEGLKPLVGAPLEPSVTEDRLAPLLSLMAECGAVVQTEGGEYTVP